MPELYHLLKKITEGHTAEARKELADVLQRDPNHLEAWSLMALAVSQPEQKADCYRRVLALDPGNENARYQLRLLEARLNAPAQMDAPPAPAPVFSFPPPANAPVYPPSEPPIQTMPTQAATAHALPTPPPELRPTPTPLPAPPAVAARPADNAPAAQFKVDGCLPHLGYLALGTLLLSFTGMGLSLVTFLSGDSTIDNVPDTAIGGVCYGAMMLIVFPLLVFLVYKGWKSAPEMSPTIKLISLFGMLTPLGWYWIGRGAVVTLKAFLGKPPEKPAVEPGASG